jgi:hypothetical protein
MLPPPPAAILGVPPYLRQKQHSLYCSASPALLSQTEWWIPKRQRSLVPTFVCCGSGGAATYDEAVADALEDGERPR